MKTKFATSGLRGKLAAILHVAAITGTLVFSPFHAKAADIPTLDDMAGDWIPASKVGSWPSVSNFHGALKTDANILAFTSLVFPPYIQGGRKLDLSINGHLLNAAKVRWYPYQVLREATVGDLTVDTTVRMVFENQGVLLRVAVRNDGKQEEKVDVGLDFRGLFRRFDGAWAWRIPWVGGPEPYRCSIENSGMVYTVKDTQTRAAAAYAFRTRPTVLKDGQDLGTGTWNISIKPGEVSTLDFVLAIGEDPTATVAQAGTWAQSFDKIYDEAKQLWEKRWHDAFTPGNGHYSGSAPVLSTADAQLRRVYYMGVLVPLLMERTNLPMAPRSYVTCSPQFAVTLEYMWDTALWSGLFARLDPAMLKSHLEGYLGLDYYHCYARCMQSGKPAGPWYSANDLSLFTMFWSYVCVTGDWSILKDTVDGRTVLQHMDGIATHWKSLVKPGAVLADYGAAANLLECVPTYINQVPSLNAANVWMMRRMAEVHDRLGDTTQAAQYRMDAVKLEQEILKLYIPGQGVWNCIHNDGKTVELRHCYDYITIGQSLGDDLTPAMKTEMTAFVENELIVPGWMRAQSLSDPSAASSDRPDHGPKGSYDGWPALTIATMCGFGQYGKALDFLHQCETVTHEGPFAQSHELVPDGPDRFLVRIANRGWQDYNEGCGASFASESIIEGLFGCAPKPVDGPLPLRDATASRGFNGTLSGVSWKGAFYTITSGSNGLSVRKE